MTRKQKTTLARILAAGALLIAAVLAPLESLWRLFAFLLPYAVIGHDVLWKAIRGIVRGQVFDENFLMALATVGALCIGEYAEASFVMLFYQVGELFQSIAVGKSRRSIASLMDIRSDTARVERGGEYSEVEPDEVAVGETIEVRPGERIPHDGEIIEGRSTLDTAALTGESLPRAVEVGDAVISGCINVDGLLHVRVSKPYGESTVARILDMVESSAQRKSRSEAFITRFARIYTPAVVIGAVLLAVIPSLVMGDWAVWIERALTFLVVSCPCALVISVPLSFFGGIGGASRKGILFKGSNYLEALGACDTVVLDKTGTLTRGSFSVAEIKSAEGITEQELLETAALVEQFSSHPIALSLLRAWGKQPDPSRVSEVENVVGEGICACLDGVPVAVGNMRLMERMNIALTEYSIELAGSGVFVARDGKLMGYLSVKDELKPGTKEALADMRRAGVKRIVMLTGDRGAVAAAVAKDLALDAYAAECLPDDKVNRLEQLIEEQRARSPRAKLAFVGDGINDAPVLSRADVGIAMGALGSDAAIEAADVVLMDDRLSGIVKAMSISRRTTRIVRQNIVFALGVKGLVLLLGALGYAGMWAAVFADVGVAVIAILNAMRTLK
ncbi:MAG: cadmium-translocating P-type ATPase [Clostridia bacterium]|nr:cadmium-translocating P-type ATPase [Clostridia bacterium]